VGRRAVKLFGGLAALSLCAAGIVLWLGRPEPVVVPDWAPDYDLTARPPDAILPGTVVEQSAPAGWSHLIIKSLPRVRPDQRAGLPAIVVEKASWMFTAFVADVVPDTGRDRHRLRAVALGLGARVKDRDTILTAETGWQLGADLGLFGGEILRKGYDVQRKAVVVVHGPSLGLLDTPVWFRCGDDNRLARYRYALLVDAPTGRLDVLLWSLGADGAACGELAELVVVAPDTLDPAELVVDRKKVNALGIPSDDAFAVDALPPGRRLALPPDLRPLAAQTRFTADAAHALETRLRSVLAESHIDPTE